jgi:hypothetical protein
VVKRGVLVRLPAPLNAAAHILDLARKGAFHSDVALHVTHEAKVTDEAIAKAAGIDGPGAAKEIEKIRYALASDVAELAGRIGDALKLDRILDLSTVDPKDDPEGAPAANPIDAIDVDPEEELARREYDKIIVEAMGESGGMLAWDAALASVAEECGARSEAAKVRKRAKERWAERNSITAAELWRMWLDPTAGYLGMRFLTLLAVAAWTRKRPDLERWRKKRPALAFQIHEDVARIHSRTHMLEDRNGQHRLIFDESDPIAIAPSVASVDDVALAKMSASIHRGVSILGSLTGHRALQWEVTTGHHQALENVADARVLTVEGGWSTFARDVLGLTAKSDIEDLRDIVRAQSAVRLALPDGSFGNLIALREMEARGRRRGWVEIVLGTMLMPHYVYELDDKLSGRLASESKRLVPLTGLPPFVGSRTEYGQQATLAMNVVRELRARATELVTDGGVLIDTDRFASLAITSGLKASSVPRIIDRWTKDGPDAPAYLRRVDRDRYTLGDAHGPARAFLEAAGKDTLDAISGGRKSVEARTRARSGLARRRRAKAPRE